MSDVIPFYGQTHAAQNITLSTSSQRVQVCEGKGPIRVRIANTSTQTAYIAAGDSTVTAASGTDMAVPAGVVEVQTFWNPGNGPLNIAAIGGSNGGVIQFTPGEGI